MLILPPYHPLASIHHLSLLLTMLPLLLLLNPVLALDISKEPSPCRCCFIPTGNQPILIGWNLSTIHTWRLFQSSWGVQQGTGNHTFSSS